MRGSIRIGFLVAGLALAPPTSAQLLGQGDSTPWLGAPAPGYPDPKAPPPPPPAPAFPRMGRVDVGSVLRVRSYPWGPVIGGLKEDDPVEILGVAGEFYRIRYRGGVGFVHRHYVATAGHPSRDFPLAYPPGCEAGGFVPRGGSRPGAEEPRPEPRPTPEGGAGAATVGKRQGNGTAAGAVAWGLDQTAGGTRRGVNSNNNRSSRDPSAWNGYCLAFVATAWGRKVGDLAASTAYNAYKNCRRSGRPFSKAKDPPAGAVYFSGPTAGNPAGHTWLATGERNASGEPLVLTTTGHSGLTGIQKIPLSRMLSMLGGEYLGWTAMP